jgi:hypothetical protein
MTSGVNFRLHNFAETETVERGEFRARLLDGLPGNFRGLRHRRLLLGAHRNAHRAPDREKRGCAVILVVSRGAPRANEDRRGQRRQWQSMHSGSWARPRSMAFTLPVNYFTFPLLRPHLPQTNTRPYPPKRLPFCYR